MFVLPVSRASQRATLPSWSRLLGPVLDSSLDQAWAGASTPAAARQPALDVNETDAAYTLVFDIPGVTREQLQVSVQGRRVSVESVESVKPAAVTPASADPSAAQAPAAPAPAERALYRERAAARYARTVSLPAEVDAATSQAKLENGVLTLTLQKRVASGATRVTVS